ncbi:MAG: DNA polymerase III subunit delta' [Alphaproteobacteria bacterium]
MTEAAAGEGPLPPRANPDLVGHERAEALLRDGYRSGRLAHAWLLTGPPGVGKATLAFRFARFVLAGGGDGDLLAGTEEGLFVPPDHPVFRRVAAGSHADLLTVEHSYDERRKRMREEIVVGDVHAMGPFLRLTAGEGGWRVVVVDSADELNHTAANALLKLLEEPPNDSLILLVSHAPGRLLPTIRSRCRALGLRPLAEDIVRRVVARCRPDLDAGETATLVRLAGGSPGHALRLAGQGGVGLYTEMIELLARPPASDVEALHGLAERLARPSARPAYHALLDLLLQWLARFVREHAAGKAGTAFVSGEDEAVRRLRARGGLAHWTEVWEKVGRLAVRAERVNLDRKQVVISAFNMIETVPRP